VTEPRRRRPPLLASALAVSAVLYASWLLAPLLNPEMDTIGGYASELAARDQPYHLVFGLADTATGLLVALASVALARDARGWARTGWLGAALFGVATALDGWVASLDCAPSIDAQCARLERLGELSVRHEAHSVSSSLAIAGAVLSVVALLRALRGPARGWFRWGLLPAAVLLAGTGGTLLEAVRPDMVLGVWQRVQLVGLSGWLAFTAVVAHRVTRWD
jgi:hypothetical protein